MSDESQHLDCGECNLDDTQGASHSCFMYLPFVSPQQVWHLSCLSLRARKLTYSPGVGEMIELHDVAWNVLQFGALNDCDRRFLDCATSSRLLFTTPIHTHTHTYADPHTHPITFTITNNSFYAFPLFNTYITHTFTHSDTHTYTLTVIAPILQLLYIHSHTHPHTHNHTHTHHASNT